MGFTGRLLADQSLAELLESIAAQTPAPGGGAAAALACALAAGLVEMSARFTLARVEYAEVHSRMDEVSRLTGELREQLLELSERELHAYEPVLDALRLRADDPQRDARLGDALSDAAESPLAIARAALQVAQLGAELSRTGNERVAGDAITGAVLAEAACCAAVRLVEINLARVPSDPRLDDATALTRQASAARMQALGGKDGT